MVTLCVGEVKSRFGKVPLSDVTARVCFHRNSQKEEYCCKVL